MTSQSGFSRRGSAIARKLTADPRLSVLTLLAICFLCFFWRLGAVGLFDLNEGLYAEAAREIYLRGDFITPRVNGILFFDKPPLALWLSALSFHLFGVTEFAARFPVAVAATLLVFLTYGFGTRFFGRRAGLLAGMMLALNVLVFGTARQMTMDIHQSLWFAIAMVCFFLGYAGRDARRHSSFILHPSSLCFLAFWAACGMGVLAKSVPGLFPIPVALGFVILHERFAWRAILRRIWQSQVLIGVPLMIAIIAPWFVLAYRANGHVFYEQFWLIHHVQLARGTDFNHAQPFWYYVPALLIGFFPWSVFLPAAGVAAWRAWKRETATAAEQVDLSAAARLFVLVWACAVPLIFTAMSSKLVSYLLPMYAAAALLVGDWTSRAIEENRVRGVVLGTGAAAAITVILTAVGAVLAHHVLTAPSAARQRHDFPPEMIYFTLHALVIGALCLAGAAIAAWRGRPGAAVAGIACAMAAVIGLTTTEGFGAADRSMVGPLHELARTAGQVAAPGHLAIYIGRPTRPSVHFYLPPAAYQGPVQPKAGAGGCFVESGEKPTIEQFLSARRPAYVLTDWRRAADLLAIDPRIAVTKRNGDWMLLHANSLGVAMTPSARTSARSGLRAADPHLPAVANSGG